MINYLKYVSGTKKGDVEQGTEFYSPFKLGDAHVDFTGSSIAESHTATATEVTAHAFTVDWTPITTVSAVKIGSTSYTILTTGTPVANTSVLVATDGTITFASGDTNFVASAVVKVLYAYDNVQIPQNDLPILNAVMDTKQLFAKARRIAVYYSQMASFQAKQDYGLTLNIAQYL